jgi:hypothetical protein
MAEGIRSDDCAFPKVFVMGINSTHGGERKDHGISAPNDAITGFGIQEGKDQGTNARRLGRAGWVSSSARLFCWDEAGMSLKTKGRCPENRNEAGMSLKKRYLVHKWRNVVEKKGG